MHPSFAALVEALHPAFERLVDCTPHTGPVRLSADVPRCAVYLFSEGTDHLYVGRTDRLRARHREHWCGRANDAPFAFKLARHATGHLKGKSVLTRAELEKDPSFKLKFDAAKAQVASMEFRWVEEVDPNRQCLLEIYATVVLGARYNDFINH